MSPSVDDQARAGSAPPPTSEAAFDILYREQWSRAVATASRITRDTARAEELAQEAFTRAFDRWNRVGVHPAPAAWVLRVAINLAIDDARRSRRRGETVLERDIGDTVTGAGDEAVVTRITVSAALASLPPKQRQAVTLRYLAGFDEPEIAAAIGVRRGTVKTHLKRGLARLREQLGADGALEGLEP